MRWFVSSIAAVTLLACGDDGGAPADAGTETDAFVPTDAGTDASVRPCPPLPGVAPAADPTPIVVERWMMGSVGTSSDPVLSAIEAGTFTVPAEGVDGDGVDWFPVAPDDDGRIETGLGGIFYAVTRVDVPEGTRVFARLDTVLSVYVNGVPQPGDLYGSRRMRVPLPTRPGENLIAVRSFGSRRDPEVQLFATPDEIVFNPNDLTAPDLRVGDDARQWLGVPVANTTERPLLDVTVRVVENDWFEASAVELPALAPGAVTKVPFELVPKAAWETPDTTVSARLRVESCSLDAVYETTVELGTVAADVPFRRTFRSRMDGSAQYFGVRPPADFDPESEYALVLSLHGASVEAIGQAGAYSEKDWAIVVAPTNRRPFGFDWEEWGRLDAVEVLETAQAIWRVDPTRVYLTGHSMGGHGTWHLGVMFPGRFATIGPSAGWESFYSYGGASRPSGPVGRARAHSDTLVYLSNLARRGVYIIHGDADDNVPVTEGRNMYDAVQGVTSDVVYHEEPGAGHWWDDSATPGADCVDWPPLFDFMQERTLDPTELDFDFRTPGPWVSPTHSYATIVSVSDPMQDATLVSGQTSGDEVTLVTGNVRALVLDGTALAAKGIARVVVDETTVDVTDGPLPVGPSTGKRLGRSGPLNQAFHRPFCFVYAEDASPVYRHYASYLVSVWAIIGNGHACAVPASAVTEALRADHQLVWLGVPESALPDGAESPFDWSADAVSVGSWTFSDAAAAVVVPRGDGLDAVMVTTEGDEHLLFRHQPFSSRAGLPDYTVWSEAGGLALGYFDPEWAFDAALGVGP